MKDELNRKKSEYLLELALQEQMEHDPEIQNFKAEDELTCPHVFSEAHDKNVRRILKTAKRAENRKRNQRRALQLAAGIAVVLCVSSVTVINSKAFRVSFANFLLDVREEYSLIFFEKRTVPSVTKNFKEQEPTYIPSGFSIDELTESEDSFTISYLNDNTGWYFLSYFQSPGSLSVDTEDAERQEVLIDGNQAILINKNDIIHVIMLKEGALYDLVGNISEEESIKILESIK